MTRVPVTASQHRVLAQLDALGAARVVDLVERLGGHPNATRQHLESLIEDGLVESSVGVGSGRGRPPLTYSLTMAGRRALVGETTVDYLQIVEAMADEFTATGDVDVVERIGRRWGRSESRSMENNTVLAVTIDLLDRLGYTPEPLEDNHTLALRSCPLLEAAVRHTDIICTLHRTLIEGALEAQGLPSDGVDLQAFAGEGYCLLRLDSPR